LDYNICTNKIKMHIENRKFTEHNDNLEYNNNNYSTNNNNKSIEYF